MSQTHVAGFVTTNLDSKSINDGFLAAMSVMLAKLLHTDVEFVTLELQPNVAMVKAASSAPMLNLRLFHNSDCVNSDTKHGFAQQIAAWLAKHVKVPQDRVLVLFIDTRCCSVG
ncbi:unnamed protein product [Candidula unifasciata]|uniref:L-dopachrome isomerase n=1 Tax=Candidula unifasciata TaxID=100452 RepID=A0A8S3ZG40_9EUPU|nr:unnamed protein product [Candidula unifasciata]